MTHKIRLIAFPELRRSAMKVLARIVAHTAFEAERLGLSGRPSARKRTSAAGWRGNCMMTLAKG